jgi:hypothetical protein
MLDQFDEAVALGNDGRTAHGGATREIRAVSSEILRTVRVMDGRNRQRFADQAQLLGSLDQCEHGAGDAAAGRGAGGGTPAGGEVRPAARGAPGQMGRWRREPPPIVATVGGGLLKTLQRDRASAP